MTDKRPDTDAGEPDGRPPADRDLAIQARIDLPRQVVDSGLFDLDGEPDQLVRLREIFAHLPDRTVVDLADRLQSVGLAQGSDLGAFVASHGITPAEERLLASLLNGETVVEHAASQGISINTARTHMRRLLEKTGSRGQLDLVRKARDDR